MQNAAARLITNVPRYSHITPVLCSLHWLPVKFRIDFKILLLTFKAIYGHAPGYLIDLIAIKEQPRCNLRSASGLILKYPSLKLKKTLGDRAFSSAAPNLWNNLPLHIRLEDNFERFKSLLKTHLFRLAFDMQYLVFYFILFLALFTFSLDYFSHFSFYLLLTFEASVVTRF